MYLSLHSTLHNYAIHPFSLNWLSVSAVDSLMVRYLIPRMRSLFEVSYLTGNAAVAESYDVLPAGSDGSIACAAFTAGA